MRARRLALAALGLALAGPLAARALLTQEEALALAFPAGTEVAREARFLTAQQMERARGLAAVPIESELWTRYVGRKEGKVVATAYFDTHRVRTLPETLLVLVGPEGQVVRVEVVAFGEPPEYLARRPWFAQFEGRKLDPELAPGRSIRMVTGATLSARAASAAVRRVLAVHQALADGEPAPAATPSGEPR